jgi:hypothetical protein
MKPCDRVYLGDGVYSIFNGYQIILTTENGTLCQSNTIYLEPETIVNLLKQIDWVGFLKKSVNDPSIISSSELDRYLHSDPNDTGWTK